MRCTQSCPTLCDPVDGSPPGSSVHGIPQTRILEWVAVSSSRGSSQPRDQTRNSWVSCLAGSLYHLRRLGSPSGVCKTVWQTLAFRHSAQWSSGWDDGLPGGTCRIQGRDAWEAPTWTGLEETGADGQQTVRPQRPLMSRKGADAPGEVFKPSNRGNLKRSGHMYTYDWFTLLYSKKLTHHCKSTILQ